MKEKFKIHRWDTRVVIAEVEAESLKEGIEKLVAQDVNLDCARLVGASLDGARLDGASLDGARLDGARLDGARLDGASLDGARLDGASLDGARLDGARLDGASLDCASLDGASLDGASLVGASLDGASLDGASLDGARLDCARLDGASLVGARLDCARLDGASLVGARLDGASLVGARLDGASLEFFKNDLWNVLLHVPHEIHGLALALKEGRVDGSVYQGECACLVGTIANLRGCNYSQLPDLRPDSSRPAEQWFMSIRKGDTAESSVVVKLTLEWIQDFYNLIGQYAQQKS
ncbi:MAG TPA: pentapeptide repeat-containing protein [Verrucomicrobiae bacterium]|nr:pentapeptide repeat-containing protein [Verrucomicrobiae bacterium]